MLKNLFYIFLLFTSFTATAQDVIYGVSGYGGSEDGGSIWKVNEDGSEFEVLEGYSNKSVSVVPVDYRYTQAVVSEDSTKLLYFAQQSGKTQLWESSLIDFSVRLIKEYASLKQNIQIRLAVKDIAVVVDNDSVFLLNTTTDSYKFLRRSTSRKVFAWHPKFPVRHVNDELIVLDGNSFNKYSMDGQFLGRFASYEDDLEELDSHFVVDDEHIYAFTVSVKRLIRISLTNPSEITEINTSAFPNNGNGVYLQNGEKYLAFCNAFGDDIWVYDKAEEELKTLDINKEKQYINVSQLLSFVGNRLYFARGENSGTGFITFTDDSQNITIAEYNFDRYVLLNLGETFLSYSRQNGLFIERTRSEIEIVRRFSFEYLINQPTNIIASNKTHLLYRRSAGGKYGRGDFALWDIEKKQSETLLLAGDTTYIKKVFQVSDTLFKVLEQTPFEVATVRDSVLNKEPKMFTTFGRTDLKIYNAENTTFYLSKSDSIFVVENNQLKFVYKKESGHIINSIINNKLYFTPFQLQNVTGDSLTIYIDIISENGGAQAEVLLTNPNFRNVRGLYCGSILGEYENELYLPIRVYGNENTWAGLAKIDPAKQVGMIHKEGYFLRFRTTEEELYFYDTYGSRNKTNSFFKYNIRTNEETLLINYSEGFFPIDDIHIITPFATLQLKSPDKSIDFTKPVSFDNRSGENEQLSFYLKNEGVGRSLNVSTENLYVTGKDSASFRLSLSENLTLKPNDSVKVQLDFIPVSKGIKEAKLNFNPSIKNARATSATADNSLEIVLVGTAKDKQSISLDLPTEISFATTQAITLPKTASSGLPITYSIPNTNIASIENYVLTIKNGGEITITAKQTGNTDFWSADSVTHTLNVLLPLSVEPISEDKAYPNPATSWVKIPLESKTYQHETLKVSDINGRIFNLKIEVKKSELEVDISSLPAGKYFVKLLNSNYVFVKQ